MTSKSLYGSYQGGPMGKGDPADTRIGDTERGTIYAKFVQQRCFTDICLREWSRWRRCMARNQDSWMPSYKCRDFFAAVDSCQKSFMQVPENVRRMEQEYLDDRAHFRRTGEGKFYMKPELVKEHMSPEFNEELRVRFGDEI